jgi:CBS domain-containing protein
VYPKGIILTVHGSADVSVGSIRWGTKIVLVVFFSQGQSWQNSCLANLANYWREGTVVKIRDWMNSPVHTVKPRDSVAHARSLLERHRINQLPVIVDGALVGIVTDRDLRNASPSAAEMAAADIGRMPAGMVDPSQVAVESVMTEKVFSLGPEDSVEDAVRVMRRERFGAIPVVEHNRLVGVLTRSDVLDAFMCMALGAEAGPDTKR